MTIDGGCYEMGKKTREKLISLYEKTINGDIIFDGDVSDINYYNMFIKAASNNKLETWGSNNVCAFKCKYLNYDSVIILISIPINSSKETSTSKNIAERIMGIIQDAEEAFITIDYNTSIEVKRDKVVYITLVKIIKEGDI